MQNRKTNYTHKADYLNNNIFERPIKTYSNWQILKGVFLDFPIPEKPMDYYFSADTLKQMLNKHRKTFFGVYAWVLLISTGLWLLLSFLVVVINLPEVLPSFYHNGFLEDWKVSTTLFIRWKLLLKETWMALPLIHISGFASGMIFIAFPDFGLKYALPYGVAIGLAGGIGFGIGGGMMPNIILGIIFGIIAGLKVYKIGSKEEDLMGGLILFGILFSGFSLYTFCFIEGFLLGLLFGLPFAISKGILFGLFMGLIMGEKSRLNHKKGISIKTAHNLFVHLIAAFVLSALFGWQMGLAMFVSYVFIHLLPILFYVYYSIDALTHHQLDNNPYLKYARIRLPMKSLDKKLIQEAQKNPQRGKEFVDFLLQYRPFQHNLAERIQEIL